MQEKEVKISKATIVRTFLLVLTIVNAVLALCGKAPLAIDESAVYDAVTAVSVIVIPVVTWWKNNSITKEAIKADEVLKELKNERE